MALSEVVMARSTPDILNSRRKEESTVMVDRLRPAKNLMRLIQELSGHQAFGLTVEDIAARMEVTTRTVRRLLGAVKDIEPDLSYHLAEDGQTRRWYLPSVKTRMPVISAEQLAGLTAIASFMRAQGHQDHERNLLGLRNELQGSLDRAHALRLDPDLEVLDSSIEVTHRPGPKATFDPVVRSQLLDAIIRERQVTFTYRDVRGLKTTRRRTSPHALIVGPRTYLICRDEVADGIRSFALTGISDLAVSDLPATRSELDVSAYVAQSFGAFHDGEFHQWTLRFRAGTAHELSSYQFHPSQTMTVLPDGEVEISFHCESIQEVAYECFRWSEHLVAVGPETLRSAVSAICERMLRACDVPR
jgi:predicted DNA-binding transcriptional regulator YafY